MLTRIEAPAVEPVTLAEAKAQLSVIGTADDALLSRLISSASAAFDGPEGKLARCLISQRWQLDLADFPIGSFLWIPMPPIISVESVTYRDYSDDEQTLSDITVSGLGSTDHCIITPATRWPSGKTISVEFTAGFGEDADAVPQDIRDAILAVVGSRYAWRESEVMSSGSLSTNPEVQDVIDRWRIRGFG